MDTKKGPVIVQLHIEGFGASEDDTHTIVREEWDAMTPAQRMTLINEVAEEFASNIVSWGWDIRDPDDAAAVYE